MWEPKPLPESTLGYGRPPEKKRERKEVSSHAIYMRCPPGPRPLPQRPNFKGHVTLRTSLIRASFFCAVFAQSERRGRYTTEPQCKCVIF